MMLGRGHGSFEILLLHEVGRFVERKGSYFLCMVLILFSVHVTSLPKKNCPLFLARRALRLYVL